MPSIHSQKSSLKNISARPLSHRFPSKSKLLYPPPCIMLKNEKQPESRKGV
ncbi:hypothetical protein OP500_07565 [Kingella sp. SNUBH-2017]|uniref:Uncharacterized protein n=1 Tax=Kingella pumchi TaxID=2779506 RepID=A0ABS9NQS8_9NEIS|nr:MULTISPECIES: hypothetical protein [Kingella]MCG6505070.1 hypothetical protein [Kingella pumchi]MDD2183163.1 hypothetical protein [Kingella sp. SNUBH-2017]